MLPQNVPESLLSSKISASDKLSFSWRKFFGRSRLLASSSAATHKFKLGEKKCRIRTVRFNFLRVSSLKALQPKGKRTEIVQTDRQLISERNMSNIAEETALQVCLLYSLMDADILKATEGFTTHV